MGASRLGVRPREDAAQQFLALAGLGVARGHHDHFAPLVVVGVADQFANLVLADGGARGQVFLERTVDEVDPSRHRLADQPAADDERLQYGRAVVGPGTRHCGELPGDSLGHPISWRVGPATTDQPVRQILKQQSLDGLGKRYPAGRNQPLHVAPLQQHVERGRVQLHPFVGQLRAPVEVQDAEQCTQQRACGEQPQVPPGIEGFQQARLAGRELREAVGVSRLGAERIVPVPYKLPHIRPAHRLHLGGGEPLVVQPRAGSGPF